MFNAPPPTVSQVKSVRHAMSFRPPSFQGKTVSTFGGLLQTPQIDELGRPPQQYYPIQPGAPDLDDLDDLDEQTVIIITTPDELAQQTGTEES